MAESMTARSSGGQNLMVANPVWGRSTSSHSSLRTTNRRLWLEAWLITSPVLTSRAAQMLIKVSTEGDFTLFSTWLRNPSEMPAFWATALRVSPASWRWWRNRLPKFIQFSNAVSAHRRLMDWLSFT